MRRAYDEKYRFLSTPSARRATAWSFATRSPTIISIHALREEGDLSPCAALLLRLEFLSTPSARRATFQHRYQERVTLIYIHALREEGDLALVVADAGDVPISIHALREEGDVILMYLLTITSVFLSTPSARRATFVPSRLLWEHFEFLSTPSARRATGFGAQTPSGGYDFYPRPPRGGRPSTPGFATLSYNFYPRPPRGGRQDSETNGFRIIKFLSTPSARRATTRPPRPRRWHSISIHALREEGDPDAPRLTEMRKLFLSTPSARRATHPPVGGGDVEGISIHALREEGDVRKGRKMQWYGSFLSTPSARRAT